MRFRMLGPVEIDTGERVVPAGTPQQRLALAALALDAGRTVTATTLISRVWNEPPSTRSNLYVLVAGVRRLLRQACTTVEAPARILRHSGGYLLQAEPESVDTHRFTRLVAHARNPTTSIVDRVEQFRAALALWQGVPLSGLPGRWAASTRQAWQQQYIDAVVAWAHAEMHVDNTAAAIGPLSVLAAEYPLVESLAATLMQALAKSGRPAEALDVYATTRQQLADELGIDPTAHVQAVRLAILRGNEPFPLR